MVDDVVAVLQGMVCKPVVSHELSSVLHHVELEALDPDHGRNQVAAMVADMFEGECFATLPHWQLLARQALPCGNEGGAAVGG